MLVWFVIVMFLCFGSYIYASKFVLVFSVCLFNVNVGQRWIQSHLSFLFLILSLSLKKTLIHYTKLKLPWRPEISLAEFIITPMLMNRAFANEKHVACTLKTDELV